MITLIAVVLLLECLLTSCKTVESASSNSASRPDSYYNERISSYNKEEDKLRGGESIDSMGLRPSDIVFGKDRELFHASIDLRWLFESLSNRKTWIRLANRIIHNVRRISNSYDIHSNYIRSAVKIIMEIRRFHPDCPLRYYFTRRTNT